MPPAADITASQADRLLQLVTETCSAVEHVAAGLHRLDAMEDSLARIEAALVPVAAHYEALNKAREAAAADLSTAREREETARLNARAGLLDWLTPRRALAIIAAILAMFGVGGPLTGASGKWERVLVALVSEPVVEVAPTNNDAPPDPTPGGAP